MIKRLSKQDKEKIRELYLKGYSTKEIAEIFNVAPQTVQYHLRRMKIIRDKREGLVVKYCRNLNLKPNKDLAYVIGVLLGDGSVSQCKSGEYKGKTYKRWRFRLKTTSKDFALSVAEACKRIGLNPHIFYCDTPYYRKNPNYKIPYEVVVYNEEFCKLLFNIKLNPKNAIKYIEGFEKEFIKGFYESEGYLSKYALEIYNANRDIIEVVCYALEKIGFKYNLTEKTIRNKKYYRISILGGRKEHKRFISVINPCIKNRT